jgi:hypothetical protein
MTDNYKKINVNMIMLSLALIADPSWILIFYIYLILIKYYLIIY